MSQEKTIDVSRVLNIPDVNDRTGNDPYYLMSSSDVMKVINNNLKFNCQDPIQAKREINEMTVSMIISQAKVEGWADVKLVGRQLLFISGRTPLGWVSQHSEMCAAPVTKEGMGGIPGYVPPRTTS